MVSERMLHTEQFHSEFNILFSLGHGFLKVFLILNLRGNQLFQTHGLVFGGKFTLIEKHSNR